MLRKIKEKAFLIGIRSLPFLIINTILMMSAYFIAFYSQGKCELMACHSQEKIYRQNS